jgi:hypothetical protein
MSSVELTAEIVRVIELPELDEVKPMLRVIKARLSKKACSVGINVPTGTKFHMSRGRKNRSSPGRRHYHLDDMSLGDFRGQKNSTG